MAKKPEREWVISEYDGLELKNQYRYPLGYWSESEMVSILQRLASQHLTNKEILRSSLRRHIPARIGLLDTNQSSGMQSYSLSIGENPHFSVTVEKN